MANGRFAVMALIRMLQVCIAIEVLAAGVFGVVWLSDSVRPQPDLGHYHPATAEAIRMLERNADDNGTATDWVALGKVYLAFGLFPHGEYCCEQAARSDSDSFESHYWWGVALNQLGEVSDAVQKFQLALTLADNRPSIPDAAARCWYGIGRNLLRQEKTADAEAAFRKAFDYLPARLQLIRILVRSNRGEEAIPLLDDLISRFPRESTYYQLRARAREQTLDHEGAIEDRTLVERAPDRLRSDSIIAELQLEAGGIGLYRELGSCSRLMAGDPQQAATRLRKLLSMEWRLAVAETLVDAEIRIGNAQQAVDLLHEAMERDGTTAERLAQCAYAHRWLGQHDLSFELLQRAAELMHIESVHDELSKEYHTRAETELASGHRALALQTRGVDAFRSNLIPEAIAQLQLAVKIDPDLSNAWYFLAECHRTRDEVDKAVDALKQCLEIDDNHGRARSRLTRFAGSNQGG